MPELVGRVFFGTVTVNVNMYHFARKHIQIPMTIFGYFE